MPKGVLLHGPPGTGKTLLAKAVAHESGAQFFSQSASSFVEMFAGLGAARIRRLFHEARKDAPAIIFIDELDAVGARRGSDNNSEREQTLNQLLVEMDGFARRATSSSWPPRTCSRSSTRRCCARGASTARCSSRRPTSRAAGASSRSTRATSRCARTSTCTSSPSRPPASRAPSWPTSATRPRSSAPAATGNAISKQDFDDALERVVAGVQSNTTLNDHERRVVAYHEAGHALCRELLTTRERVHKISIVPRGQALGYVMNLPDEDSYLKTREELVDQITVLLGGRVAEAIVFGAVTTGAANDLQRVAEITHAMVHEYGDGHRDAPTTARSPTPTSSPTSRAASATRSSRSSPSRPSAPPTSSIIASHRDKLEEARPRRCSSARRSSACRRSTASWPRHRRHARLAPVPRTAGRSLGHRGATPPHARRRPREAP